MSAEQRELSRFVVGMDLGTTNSAVSYVDTQQQPWRVRTLALPQLVAPGQVEARETLPSFHYQPAVNEFAAGAMTLPWSKGGESGAGTAGVPPAGVREPRTPTVGVFAREHGALVPGRMIHSAKSWLCHSGVDRTAALLPWHGADDVERLSPVDVSARFIAHVRDVWDATFPEHPLAQQDFVLTLPASFDEVARELTVKAAAVAGLPRVLLIEEPQAVFYAWIDAHADRWESVVSHGQKILICDIGGGTTDFTLIRVRRGDADNVQFQRVAVGDHLILGGDNLDLTLAQYLERKLLGTAEDDPNPRRLEPRQWGLLVRISQRLKETLLGPNPPEKQTVSLPKSGSKLIGGALQVEVTREEVEQLLVEGFLPRVGLNEKPSTRRSGFQEFGLPFAPDAAMTKYLGQFLVAHRGEMGCADIDPARPDIVLFNGGLFESPVLRARMLEVLCSWFRHEPGQADWSPLVLENQRLDLAVANGAAYYGMVLRGQGVRIAAGLPRTYYIGVDAGQSVSGSCEVKPVSDCPSPPAPLPGVPGRGEHEVTSLHALCLIPAGLEPGQSIDLSSRRFDLAVATPVEFPLFVSSTRLTDQPGELIVADREQLTPLPPIRTVLRAAKKGEAGFVSVQLHARLTEIGTLEMWCSEVEGSRSWKLQFDVRSTTQTDVAAHDGAAEQLGVVDDQTEARCRVLIADAFGPSGSADPKSLMKQLATVLDGSRTDWPPSLLRSLWSTLLEFEAARQRSPEHEARWFNLLGFTLRPGYGLAVDDWRVNETWRQMQGKLRHNSPTCRIEWWIMWRRIAGGLTAGQQNSLATQLMGQVRQRHKQLMTGKGTPGDLPTQPAEQSEIWRMLGSLERLTVALKEEIGDIVLDLFSKSGMTAMRPALAWAIGRIGSRTPQYGPLNHVVPLGRLQDWLTRFLAIDFDDPQSLIAVVQLARRTDDRYRDLPDAERRQVLDWLKLRSAPEHYWELVRTAGELNAAERILIFGESLPKGLRIG